MAEEYRYYWELPPEVRRYAMRVPTELEHRRICRLMSQFVSRLADMVDMMDWVEKTFPESSLTKPEFKDMLERVEKVMRRAFDELDCRRYATPSARFFAGLSRIRRFLKK